MLQVIIPSKLFEPLQVYMMSRPFDSDTWSAPQLVFTKLGSFLRNRFIQGLDGSWILPIYYRSVSDYLSFSPSVSRFEKPVSDPMINILVIRMHDTGI